MIVECWAAFNLQRQPETLALGYASSVSLWSMQSPAFALPKACTEDGQSHLSCDQCSVLFFPASLPSIQPVHRTVTFQMIFFLSHDCCSPCLLARRKAAITMRILGLVHQLCMKRINVTKREWQHRGVPAGPAKRNSGLLEHSG